MRMSVTLLVMGFFVAAAGIATTLFGIAINELSLGPTLIIAGTTAFTGGLLLIGLSAVVTELGRVAEGLKTRVVGRAAARAAEAQEAGIQAAAPVAPAIAPPAPAAAASPRPPQPSIPAPPPRPPQVPVREAHAPDLRPPEPYPAAPYPASPSAVEVSAAAIERLRSSIPRTERPVVADVEGVPLSPNGAGHQQARQRAAGGVEAAPEPRVAADDRGGGVGVEAKSSRLDFLFRSKPGAPPAPQGENFETLWPDGRPGGNAPAPPQPPSRYDQIERRGDFAAPAQDRAPERGQDRGQERRSEPPPVNEPPSAAILKSGVVDGMAYTLYADGSIEAKLPHGTVRFGSIAELRAHIENNS
jgi:hypothetical protein